MAKRTYTRKTLYTGIPVPEEYREKLWKQKHDVSGKVGHDIKWPEFFDLLVDSVDESKMEKGIEKLRKK